jgi:hypothetical protein
MNERNHTSPRSIFGIPVRPLIIILIFLISLLIVFDRFDINLFLSKTISKKTSEEYSSQSETGSADREIVATPEMIAKATKEVTAKKLEQIESSNSPMAEDRFYYIIDLKSGGDLEAMDVLIKPDSVTISSSNGISTTIPRNSIKDIRRFKLPPIEE